MSVEINEEWYNLRMSNVVTISPDIQSGMPVFAGTRVPIKNLFDYLKGGESIEEFLADFPSVGRDQILELLSLAQHTFTFTEAEVYEESLA